MRVTVRVFARLREIAGRDRWECDVPSGASVADVWQAIARDDDRLAPFGRVISCAVNTAFASTRTPVHEGDEIAFLPPVSGG